MPSERARPLVAFVAVAVVCALVVAVNMLRDPTATLTTVEAAPVSELGPRVEFGTVLDRRPEIAAPSTPNVLAAALSLPTGVAGPAHRSSTQRSSAVRASTLLHARRTHAGRTHVPKRQQARPHHVTPGTPHRATPKPTSTTRPTPSHGGPGKDRHGRPKPGRAKGHGHGRPPGHDHGVIRAAPSTAAITAGSRHPERPDHGPHGRADHGHGPHGHGPHGRADHGHSPHGHGVHGGHGPHGHGRR